MIFKLFEFGLQQRDNFIATKGSKHIFQFVVVHIVLVSHVIDDELLEFVLIDEGRFTKSIIDFIGLLQ